MTLYFIGLGLYDEKDITVRGLETVKKCSHVFLEHYTSILHCDIDKLNSFYGKEIIIADRDMVEKDADKIIEPAKDSDVAFLVAGDPMCATTHTDLMIRARELGVSVIIINNASIINAVGNTGLETYKFGKVTSLVFPDDNWLPDTPYNYIRENLSLNMHTLCLLDIKVKEQSKSNMRSGVKSYDKPRFMTVNEGLSVLLRLEEKHKLGLITNDTRVVGIARMGAPDCLIKYGKISEILDFDFDRPLHAIIIPAKNLHFVEEDALKLWK